MKKLLASSLTAFLLTGLLSLSFAQAEPGEPACTDLTPTCDANELGPNYYDCRSHSNGCCSVLYHTYYCVGGGTQTFQRATNYQSKTCVKYSPGTAPDTHHVGYCN